MKNKFYCSVLNILIAVCSFDVGFIIGSFFNSLI